MSRPRPCVTKDELIALTGWSDRTVRLKAELKEIEWRYVDAERSGRRPRAYFVDSLPAEFQAKYSRQQLTSASQELATRSSGQVLPPQSLNPNACLNGAGHAAPPTMRRMIVNEEQHRQAEQRLAAIQPLLDCQRTKRRPDITSADGRRFTSIDALAGFIAEQCNVSKSTVYQWALNFRQEGLAGLADKIRSDSGTSRFFAKEHLAQARAFVISKYFRDRLTYRMTYERLKESWNSLDTNGEKIPSYTTVRAFLKNTDELPEPVKIYGREGSTVYEAKCSPILIRDFAVAINEVWVSDHGKHDVWVWNDCFSGIPRGIAIRPWLTAILDMRSRKIVGANWNAQPSGHTVSTALRHAVVSFGIPQKFYIDNGKDYESIGRIDYSIEASGVLHRLGVEPQYCIPKHPQSKLIESWFSTVRKRFDSRFGPFYCGDSPSNRPEECDLVLKEHKQFLERKRAATPLMPASEFIRIAALWVFEDYNDEYRAHSGRGMEGRTPNEVFQEEYPANARRLDSHDYIQELFWKRETRQVLEGGTVQMFNERYEPADIESSAALFSLIGRSVLVACDPYDIGDAIVLDHAGTPLGRIRAQKLVAHGPISRDDVKHSMRTRRAVKRAVEQHLQAIGAQVESEVDMFRRRAAISAPNDFVPEPKALPAPIRGSLAPATAPQFVEDVVDDILSDN
ncbi:MAG TPA: DDE-type integrase/transposase/recombinase [Clostridia bacterium]|nr:DDE-type integrase/transposase/recombinase [Clostridia bacterium]